MAQYINREKLLKRMEGYCEANCGCKPHEDALCPSCVLGDAIYMVEEQRIVNSKNLRGRKGATVALSKTEKTTKPHGRLIDADKIGLTNFEIILCQKGNPFKNALEMLLEKIENAPTVIPASEEDE